MLSALSHRKAVREPTHTQIKDHRFLWLEGSLRDSPFTTFISWGIEGKRGECWIFVIYRDNGWDGARLQVSPTPHREMLLLIPHMTLLMEMCMLQQKGKGRGQLTLKNQPMMVEAETKRLAELGAYLYRPWGCPGSPDTTPQSTIWRPKEAAVQLQLESEGLRTSGANIVNPSPRAGEDQHPSSNRRKERKMDKFLFLLFCSIQALNRWDNAHSHRESNLLSSPAQMLMSCGSI